MKIDSLEEVRVWEAAIEAPVVFADNYMYSLHISKSHVFKSMYIT